MSVLLFLLGLLSAIDIANADSCTDWLRKHGDWNRQHPLTYTPIEILDSDKLYAKSNFSRIGISDEAKSALRELSENFYRRDQDAHTVIAQLNKLAGEKSHTQDFASARDDFESLIFSMRDQARDSRHPTLFTDLFLFKGLVDGRNKGIWKKLGIDPRQYINKIASEFESAEHKEFSIDGERARLHKILAAKLVELEVAKDLASADKLIYESIGKDAEVGDQLTRLVEERDRLSEDSEEWKENEKAIGRLKRKFWMNHWLTLPRQAQTEGHLYRTPGVVVHDGSTILNYMYYLTFPISSAPDVIARTVLKIHGKRKLALKGEVLAYGSSLVYGATVGKWLIQKAVLLALGAGQRKAIEERTKQLTTLQPEDAVELKETTETALRSGRTSCDIVHDPNAASLLREQDELAKTMTQEELWKYGEKDSRFDPLLHEEAVKEMAAATSLGQDFVLKKSDALKWNCALKESYQKYRLLRRQSPHLSAIAKSDFAKLSAEQKKKMDELFANNLYFRSNQVALKAAHPDQEVSPEMEHFALRLIDAGETVDEFISPVVDEKSAYTTERFKRELSALPLNALAKDYLARGYDLYAKSNKQRPLSYRQYALITTRLVYGLAPGSVSDNQSDPAQMTELKSQLEEWLLELQKELSK